MHTILINRKILHLAPAGIQDIIEYMKLSAIILTKNAENTIIDCLDSVSFADEIIVIDDESEDRTRDVLASYKRKPTRYFKHALENDFGAQRNFALEKAQGEWVVFIDDDERVTSKLAANIQKVIDIDEFDAYKLKRVDSLWGKKLLYGETGDMWLVRLAKRNQGTWYGKVHETWNIKGAVGKLDGQLIHYPHSSISGFLSKINTYSTLRAEELYEKKTQVSWIGIIAYPKAKFFFNYILKQGFKDGTPGLVHAIMMSMHSFLVRGKLYLLWKNGRKLGH